LRTAASFVAVFALLSVGELAFIVFAFSHAVVFAVCFAFLRALAEEVIFCTSELALADALFFFSLAVKAEELIYAAFLFFTLLALAVAVFFGPSELALAVAVYF
jgi:hypothetical protein